MSDWDEEEDCLGSTMNQININGNSNSNSNQYGGGDSAPQWNPSSDFNSGFGGGGGFQDSGSRGRGRGRGRGGSSFGDSGGQNGFQSRGGGCHNCGEDGHMKRDCPNPRKQFGSGDGGSRNFGSGGCHNCGEDGHMKRDCPNPRKEFSSQGGGGNSGSGCHNCGEEGHMKRECLNPPKSNGAGGDKPAAQTYVPVELDENVLFEQGVAAGSNISAFDNVAVQVSGSGEIPEKLEDFSQSSLRSLLKENVNKAGYTRPLPIQKHSIPIIMSGRDLMACAQTGSGKTAAFLLPILHYILENNLDSHAYEETVKPAALILAPTRELAIQIFNEARKFSVQSIVKVCIVYGGTAVAHQHRMIQKGCHILVATPGRLLDYVERSYVAFDDLKFLVLDEADRMLDMGFKTSIEKVVNHPSTPDKLNRQTLMFSATFAHDIQELSKKFLNDYVFVVTGMIGAANVDVTQTILKVSSTEKREMLLAFVREKLEENKSEKILVFVETKRMADFIALYLSNNDVSTTSIHGDRFQSQREEALMQFKNGVRNVLVATAVAARGLDIKGVGIVLNFDMPKEVDEYVHRIGRTGRVGNPGKAVSYFDSISDAPLAKNLVKLLSDGEQEVPDWLVECAHTSGGVMSFQGVNKFGAADIRNRVKTEEFSAAPSYMGGPIDTTSSQVPDDDECWD